MFLNAFELEICQRIVVAKTFVVSETGNYEEPAIVTTVFDADS